MIGTPVVNAVSPSVVSCVHSGLAAPQQTGQATNVRVNGVPVMVIGPLAYQISGCTLPPQAGGPCATAIWSSGATKVFASRTPIATQNGIGVCTPTGTGLLVNGLLQQKVKAL